MGVPLPAVDDEDIAEIERAAGLGPLRDALSVELLKPARNASACGWLGGQRHFDPQTLGYVLQVTVSAPVPDNVAVAVAPAFRPIPPYIGSESVNPDVVVRYAASRSVLHRFTNPNSSSDYSNYEPSSPGPETAQSRRAERHPATPNRVVIVPTSTTLRSVNSTPTHMYNDSCITGGPAPHVYFIVLLNNARYFDRITGGPHAGCLKANPGSSTGPGYGAPLESPLGKGGTRGGTFDGVVPLGVIHCPGAYKIQISALNSQGRPYPPFGSATFRVR